MEVEAGGSGSSRGHVVTPAATANGGGRLLNGLLRQEQGSRIKKSYLAKSLLYFCQYFRAIIDQYYADIFDDPSILSWRKSRNGKCG
jgi:hypothetical protein